MARIISQGVLGNLSGTIAGQIVARNRYGYYSRNYVIPINRMTDKQETARAVVSQLAIAWAALSPGQRASWNTYAAAVPLVGRTGQPDFLTGFNHFVRSNASRLRIAESRVDDGPIVLSMPAADPILAGVASEATQAVTLTFNPALGWSSEDFGHLMLYSGYPQSPTRNFYAGKMIFVNSLNGDTSVPLTSPLPITMPVELQFAVGQKLFLQYRIMRGDGRLSIPFQITCVAGA